MSDVDNPVGGLLCQECRQLDLDFQEIFSVNPEVSSRRRFWKITLQNTETCSLCKFFEASARCLGIFSPKDVLGIRAGLVSEACLLNDPPDCIAEGLPGCTTLDTVALHIERYDYLIKTFTSIDTRGTRGAIEGGGIHTMGYLGAHLGAHLILPTKRIVSNDVQRDKSSCDAVLGRQVPVEGVDYGLITEWLKTCTSTHVDCVESQRGLAFESVPGFRLIDCFTSTVVPASQALEREYVTLSYVWDPKQASTPPGTAPGASETSSSFTSPNDAYSLPEAENLPTVIRDSMTVVRNLGYRYLWVDRYCIPQNDAQAKHTQIQNMGKIYSWSILTIIAAAGSEMGPESGLPGVSSRPRIPQLSTTVCDGQLPLILYRCPGWDIDLSIWNSRGWTFQEGLLAKRRLVFTSHYVYFQCCIMDKSEQLSQPQKLLRDDLAPTTLQMLGWEMEQWDLVPANVCRVFPYSKEWRQESNIWLKICEFNQRRTLSFDSDALDAMRGILQLYQTSSHHDLRMRFLCGLTTANPVPSKPIEIWVDPNDKDDRSVTDFKGIRFVVDQNPNIDLATAQLVPGLLWKDNWSQSLHFMNRKISAKLTDYTKENPRRTMFPSWTWAGWKKTQNYDLSCECLGFKYFGHLDYQKGDCLIQPPIMVSFDGEDMNWTTDNLHITELSDLGKIPTYLVLTGKVIDVELTSKVNMDEFPWNPVSWRYTSPLQLRDESVYLPPDYGDEGEGKILSNLLLLLLHRTRRMMVSGLSGVSSYRFLLLRPVEDAAHGLVYERLTSTSIQENSFCSDSGNMLYDLETREVRIR